MANYSLYNNAAPFISSVFMINKSPSSMKKHCESIKPEICKLLIEFVYFLSCLFPQTG